MQCVQYPNSENMGTEECAVFVFLCRKRGQRKEIDQRKPDLHRSNNRPVWSPLPTTYRNTYQSQCISELEFLFTPLQSYNIPFREIGNEDNNRLTLYQYTGIQTIGDKVISQFFFVYTGRVILTVESILTPVIASELASALMIAKVVWGCYGKRRSGNKWRLYLVGYLSEPHPRVTWTQCGTMI